MRSLLESRFPLIGPGDIQLCNPAVVLEGVGLSAGLVLCARAVSVNLADNSHGFSLLPNPAVVIVYDNGNIFDNKSLKMMDQTRYPEEHLATTPPNSTCDYFS